MAFYEFIKYDILFIQVTSPEVWDGRDQGAGSWICRTASARYYATRRRLPSGTDGKDSGCFSGGDGVR
jgi:hypothetical protein